MIVVMVNKEFIEVVGQERVKVGVRLGRRYKPGGWPGTLDGPRQKAIRTALLAGLFEPVGRYSADCVV
jgi:hypothetical protein